MSAKAKVIAENSVMVAVGKLKEFPGNPRRGDKEAIKESILENGFFDPLIVRKKNGHVLSGNHRLQAAIELGMEEVPVVYVDVTAKEAKKILLSANRASDKSTYDAHDLMAFLEPLEATGSLGGTLWSPTDMQELLSGMGGDGNKEDPGPKEPGEGLNKKWKVERGFLYQIGDHRLLCGDAENEEEVARLLDGATPNLCVTDPPYGVEYDAMWRESLNHAEGRRGGKVTNDDRSYWSRAFQKHPGDVLYSFAPPGPQLLDFGKSIIDAGFEIRAGLVWVKPNFPISRGHYTYQHEPIWYAIRKGGKAHWIGGKDGGHSSSVWAESLDANVDGKHSTQKPVALFERAIRNHSGDVYEPFAGSGTCLIAAENHNRKCYAMEIEPGYVATILERCEIAGMEIERLT